MAGYWQRPEATKEVLRADGWFDTGDIGYVDPDGYLFISGRSKELIKVSGFSVFPAEVESLLYKHPDIAEAVVIGVPDAYRGETVKAFVVLKPGSIATGDQIVAWARQETAAYKAPRVVEIRESLPKNGSGKIMRRLLVDEETARTSG
jgi:long-chain acyl-CoA synthetase